MQCPACGAETDGKSFQCGSCGKRLAGALLGAAGGPGAARPAATTASPSTPPTPRRTAACALIILFLANRPVHAQGPWPIFDRTYISERRGPAVVVQTSRGKVEFIGVGDQVRGTNWTVADIQFLPSAVWLIDRARRVGCLVHERQSPWYVNTVRINGTQIDALPRPGEAEPEPPPAPRTYAWYAELAKEYRAMGRSSEALVMEEMADRLRPRSAPILQVSALPPPAREPRAIPVMPASAPRTPAVTFRARRDPPEPAASTPAGQPAVPEPEAGIPAGPSVPAKPDGWDDLVAAAAVPVDDLPQISLTGGQLRSELLRDKREDAVGKYGTQPNPTAAKVVRYFLVKGDVSKPVLEKFLRDEYAKAMKERFLYHPRPTLVTVMAYATREAYRAGKTGQLAKLHFGPLTHGAVEVEFNEAMYKQIGAKAEIRDTLPQDKRVLLYRILDLIDDRNSMEELRSSDGQGRSREPFRQYAAALFGLTEDQLVSIESEGVEKGWAQPPNLFDPESQQQ